MSLSCGEGPCGNARLDVPYRRAIVPPHTMLDVDNTVLRMPTPVCRGWQQATTYNTTELTASPEPSLAAHCNTYGTCMLEKSEATHRELPLSLPLPFSERSPVPYPHIAYLTFQNKKCVCAVARHTTGDTSCVIRHIVCDHQRTVTMVPVTAPLLASLPLSLSRYLSLSVSVCLSLSLALSLSLSPSLSPSLSLSLPPQSWRQYIIKTTASSPNILCNTANNTDVIFFVCTEHI